MKTKCKWAFGQEDRSRTTSPVFTLSRVCVDMAHIKSPVVLRKEVDADWVAKSRPDY